MQTTPRSAAGFVVALVTIALASCGAPQSLEAPELTGTPTEAPAALAATPTGRPTSIPALPTPTEGQSASQMMLLYFVDAHPGSGADLRMIGESGAPDTRVLEGGWRTRGGPDVSPDGSRVAFSEGDGTYYQILILDRGRSETTPLTDTRGYNYDAAWSPDGTQIAYVSDRYGRHQIYVINADGTGRRRLTSGGNDEFCPRWSPDGESIAFVVILWNSDASHPRVHIASADGTGERLLVDVPGREDCVDWSPDGSRIVLTVSGNYGEEGTSTGIYLANGDGSDLSKWISVDGTPDNARWMPDGEGIAMIITGIPKDGLYLVRPGTTVPITLVRDTGSFAIMPADTR